MSASKVDGEFSTKWKTTWLAQYVAYDKSESEMKALTTRAKDYIFGAVIHNYKPGRNVPVLFHGAQQKESKLVGLRIISKVVTLGLLFAPGNEYLRTATGLSDDQVIYAPHVERASISPMTSYTCVKKDMFTTCSMCGIRFFVEHVSNLYLLLDSCQNAVVKQKATPEDNHDFEAPQMYFEESQQYGR